MAVLVGNNRLSHSIFTLFIYFRLHRRYYTPVELELSNPRTVDSRTVVFVDWLFSSTLAYHLLIAHQSFASQTLLSLFDYMRLSLKWACADGIVNTWSYGSYTQCTNLVTDETSVHLVHCIAVSLFSE
jgi:hypothetical protein